MIAPQLAQEATITSLTSYLTDPAWVMEQKLDGHRVMLMSQNGGPPLALTRGGAPYSKRIPQSIRDFRFPEGEWVLDGELVDQTYWVFDLVGSRVTSTATPLFGRRRALETFFDVIAPPFNLVPQAATTDQKIALAEKALVSSFEGLILKKAGSPYWPGGRTPDWLKVKFVSTVDVIVLDVRDDGKDSVRLGIHGPKGLREIGRSSLIGKEKSGRVEVGDVLEVRYLYVGANGRLYQPTIIRKRDDKRPDECLDAQLRHVNKEVMATL